MCDSPDETTLYHSLSLQCGSSIPDPERGWLESIKFASEYEGKEALNIVTTVPGAMVSRGTFLALLSLLALLEDVRAGKYFQ
jgi:hypothetical protein